MKLSDVYINRGDGGLGTIAPAGDGQRVVIGVCSLGQANQLYSFSDLNEVAAIIGTGPLARAVADQLAIGGGTVYAIPAAATIGGTTSPAATNPNVPAVSTTGNPLDQYDVVITITRAGAVGAAAFTYSLDGGDNTSEETALGATYLIQGTGMTVNFTAGNYTVGQTWRFTSTTPRSNLTDIQTAIRAAFDSNLIYEYIQIAQSTDPIAWAALDALGQEAEQNYRQIFFLCETVAPGDDVNAWVNARLSEKSSFTSRFVAISTVFADTVDTLSGRVQIQSGAGRIGGRISGSAVHQKAARVRAGAIPGLAIIAPYVGTATTRKSTYTNAHALALTNAGFIAARTRAGRGGVYIEEDRMAAANTSDYKIIPNVRVMNKAITLAREAMVDFLQDDIDPTDLVASTAALVAAINNPMKDMKNDGEITRGRVIVPPGQDILASSKLRIKIRITPKGYLREIVADVLYENPALGGAA